MAAKAFKLAAKAADGKRVVIETLTGDSSLADLEGKLAPIVGIPAGQQQISIGFPPKDVVMSNQSATLTSLAIKSGESLTVKRLGAVVEMKQGKSDGPVVFSISRDSGSFRSRSMPADNSCLFHGAAFLFKNGAAGAEVMLEMRTLIAAEVARNPAKYTTTILGSPNATYQSMIKNPGTWGGALELGIFSEVFKAEVIALDHSTCSESTYGMDAGYTQRVFFLYSGRHYDVLVFAASTSAKEQTLFSTRDAIAWDRARDFCEGQYKNANPKAEKKVWSRSTAASGAAAATPAKTASAAAPAKAATPTPTPAKTTPAPAKATMGTPASVAPWSCSACTMENPAAVRSCETCGTARAGGGGTTGGPGPLIGGAPAVVSTRATATTGGGATTGAASAAGGKTGPFMCSACTYRNTSGAVCEMCSEPRP